MTHADKILGLIRTASTLLHNTNTELQGCVAQETVDGLHTFISGLRSQHHALCCTGCGQYNKGEGHGTYDECRCVEIDGVKYAPVK